MDEYPDSGCIQCLFIPKFSSSIYFMGILTSFALLNLGTMMDIKNNIHHFQ